MMSDMTRIWNGVGGPGDGDEVKVAAELQFLSEAAAVNMGDVIGENTAIVIPQAPEETAAAVAPTVAAAASASKPLKHSSSGGRSSGGGGRGKRSLDAGGSSTASAETLLPFKCELCEYRARWPSEMTQHAKNHSDEKPYHCPQCTYRSKWKWDVVKHLKRCGGGGTARDVIDTTVNQVSTLTSTSSSVVTSAVMPAASQTARRRRNNVRSLLIDVPSVRAPPTTPYERAPAGSVTESSTLQPPAVTTMSSLSSTGAPRDNLSNGPPNVMVCYRSGFQDPGPDLTATANQGGVVQTDNTVTPLVVQSKPEDSASPTPPPTVSLVNQGLHYCLQCSFVGHSPAELRRHLRVHSDEKPYSCRTCCYSSKWKCDLKKHLRAYNHVSAVPLAYGGHGRKPTPETLTNGAIDTGDYELPGGPMNDDDDSTGDASATPDSGSQSCAVPSFGALTKTSHQKMPNGSNFAGITVGGRMRCRRCDFEAIDLTSFLQHKSAHASARKNEHGDQSEFLLQTVATSAGGVRPSHHRRKSSKQVRVLPDSKTDNYTNTGALVADHGVNNTRLSDDDQENLPDAADGSKFWKSLGLRSKNGISCSKSSEPAAAGNGGASAMDVAAVNSREKEHQMGMAEVEELKTSSHDAAGAKEGAGIAVDGCVTSSPTSSSSSPRSSSSDTDYVDYADDDQPVNLCRRASPKPDHPETPTDAQTGHQMSSHVTTTEADDASGLSKRKRKLRMCDKCGYVTDNLTTLQRHAAKHGCAGMFTCLRIFHFLLI